MTEKKEKEAAAKAPKPKPEKAAEAPAAEEKKEKTDSSPKSKKINKMSLGDIEAKLEELKSVPGGMQTRFAQHLLQRKNFLKK